MEITKVKYKNELVEIDYQETSLNNRMTKKNIKSYEVPMQSFISSLIALAPIYKEIIEKNQSNNVKINGVSIKYDDTRQFTGCVIMGMVILQKRDKMTVQNTPFLFIEHADDGSRLPKGTDKILSEIIRQAELYLEGNYAESDLFEDQEGSDQDSEKE